MSVFDMATAATFSHKDHLTNRFYAREFAKTHDQATCIDLSLYEIRRCPVISVVATQDALICKYNPPKNKLDKYDVVILSYNQEHAQFKSLCAMVKKKMYNALHIQFIDDFESILKVEDVIKHSKII